MEVPDVRVTINVGGKEFTTWKSTILKYPDTPLAKAISGTWKEGTTLFFDRNYKAFSAILDYYRNGILAQPPNVPVNIFHEETKFWGLEYEKTADDYINWEEVKKEALLRMLGPDNLITRIIRGKLKDKLMTDCISNKDWTAYKFFADPPVNEILAKADIPLLEGINVRFNKLTMPKQIEVMREILVKYFHFSQVKLVKIPAPVNSTEVIVDGASISFEENQIITHEGGKYLFYLVLYY